MFKGTTFWGVASLLLYSCSLTPSGVSWGRQALGDTDKVLEYAEQNPGPGGEVGWRELLEGAIATGFGLNWLRNRKYQMVRKPQPGSDA